MSEKCVWERKDVYEVVYLVAGDNSRLDTRHFSRPALFVMRL